VCVVYGVEELFVVYVDIVVVGVLVDIVIVVCDV